MPVYKHPGVYIEESDTFENNISESPTAVPVFIGFTQKLKYGNDELRNEFTQIGSLGEYIEYFGEAPTSEFELTEYTDSESKDEISDSTIEIEGKTYTVEQTSEKYSLYNAIRFFFQNGGRSCYIVSVGDYTEPLDIHKLAYGLSILEKEYEPTMVLIPDAVQLDEESCMELQNLILEHCNKMKDRFGILDIYNGYKKRIGGNGDVITNFRNGLQEDGRSYSAVYYPWLNTNVVQALEISELNLTQESLSILNHSTDSPEYKQVIAVIQHQLNVLPPSAAMAGIYTMTDESRGVWKAPANVSLNGVSGPTVEISHRDQEDLNVSLDGKSINAIRTFPGKGTLVWGARTLDGNSSDWRYISVRRTVIMIEQSIQKGLEPFVFEPNDANTWLRSKTVIESLLTNLWRYGALVGYSPGEAFVVNVGLGVTMTAEDILEGYLRVNVLVSLIRPAEFIELNIVQKMQEN